MLKLNFKSLLDSLFYKFCSNDISSWEFMTLQNIADILQQETL